MLKKSVQKSMPYILALGLFAAGYTGLTSQARAQTEQSQEKNLESKLLLSDTQTQTQTQTSTPKIYSGNTDFVNAFIAAKNCDTQSYEMFKKKALEKEKNNWRGANKAELEVKTTLLLCSRELEWMYRDRTPEQEKLVENGITTLTECPNEYWPIKDEVLMCEFLAKNNPEKALAMADKIIDRANKETENKWFRARDTDFVARAMLDKAFILIKTKKDYKTATKLYNEVQQAGSYLDVYISEISDVLKEYLPKKNIKKGK